MSLSLLSTMVIEWLDFQVIPELREQFIQLDREIWTATLTKYPGFLGKEVWLEPDRVDRLSLVISWQTREQWKAVPIEILEQTEQEFAQKIGKGNYELLGVKEYQVRKFSETN